MTPTPDLRKALEPFKKLADEIEEMCRLHADDPTMGGPEGWSKACHWEDLRAARDAYNALGDDAAIGWQPIETAPTNESVQVYIPNAEHYGEGIYRAMLVDMGTGRRWMTSGLHIGRDCGPENQPTHWRPLPPGPEL